MGRFDNRKWVIIDVADITDEMIKNANQTSMHTLKKILNDSKAIL